MFAKKTLKDISLKGKTVLVSVDYNVPSTKSGGITDDFRIEASLPTIKYLIEQNCRVILISHRGRPEGKVDLRLSLQPVAQKLSKLLGSQVDFATDCIGQKAEEAKKRLKPKGVLLLENTRFHAEEDSNNVEFAKNLAQGAEVFVQDAFGNAHRKHASTDAITKFLPSVAGLLVEREVTKITETLNNPKHPMMAIIGGAKIADKIDVLKSLIRLADFVAVGGAMANTFLKAQGIDVGDSIYDKSEVPLAKEIIEQAERESKKRQFTFYMPQDSVVAASLSTHAHTRIVDWSAHVIASIESYPKRPERKSGQVSADELILDIGPFSGAFIAGAMQTMNTVIWNGAMGVTETPGLNGPIGPFAHGTEVLVESMLGEFGNKPYTLVGGGDTVGYIESRGLIKSFDHVSSGGGASLELLAGNKLPAVEALLDKK